MVIPVTPARNSASLTAGRRSGRMTQVMSFICLLQRDRCQLIQRLKNKKPPHFIDRNAGALENRLSANSCLPVPETFDHVPQVLRERAIISEIGNGHAASWHGHEEGLGN